ncbi:hypothetical protein [Solirubrobacter soli]|uniref:hypothetical protein n=1 Tax=Solirubrobacter soli TaxID=363832 RepID=UPI00041FE835|nr:hypothetical protein [Solirubrobacter soli]
MSDTLTRLRAADPADAFDTSAAPPADVLGRITAHPRKRRRRLAPAVALAVAGVAALAFTLLPGASQVDLAARAYAATAPEDAVILTVTTLTLDGPGDRRTITHSTSWQRGDRLHNVMDVDENGKTWRYEHDQNGPVFRTLLDGQVRAIRSDDPGWKDDEGAKGFAENLQTVVERFRARYRGMRDAGDTTFNGRPARAYTSGDETFYLDRETALPLGSVTTPSTYRVKIDPKTRKPVAGEKTGELRITETVDRFERLPATPANLRLLDAPAIDAAATRR